MDGKQSEAHRRRGQRDNMAEDLRFWFCQLSTQERLQAIAVEDVVWIRVFKILYRKHKSWMRQRGKPPTWDRDQVRKLCEKVQRNERNRSGAQSMTSSATCPNGASESRTSTPAIESRTKEVPKSRTKAGSEDKNTEAVAQTSIEKEFGDDSGGALTKEGAPGHITDSLSIAAHGSSKSSGNRSGACGDGNGDHKLQTALQVGERLQEAVRLCSLGGDSRGGVRDAPWALTLSEAELSRPRKLLNDLRLYSCRGDGEEAFSVSEKARDGDGSAGKILRGFMSIPLTEADARRVVLSPTEDPLLETAWLSQRFPKAAIGDLLANRLELSLWASYHRIGRSDVLTSPLPAVPRVIEELHVFWQTLSQRHKLRFLEGVPEAKAVIAGSSGEGTDEKGDDLIRELVLAPIAWCFKDDGASVRGVVERLQQACVDYAAADRTGPLDFSNVEQDANIGSDDLGLTTSVAGNVENHGVGDDVVSSGNTASEESSVEHVASEPSSSANTSKIKTSKKNKGKKKKAVDSISLTSGSAEGSEGAPSPEMATVGQDTSACPSLGDANLSACDDGGAGGEADEESQQGGSKANGPRTEKNARSRGAGAASEIVDVVGENAAESNDGWVVSTSRRKIKEPREESKELRRGGPGGKSSKNKEGGNHPKATAGHRESLRDSQREPYRDRGEVPTRGSKGSARSDLRHDRDDGSNAPWSRGTSRQESGSKGEEGGAWSKGGTLRERREDGSRREKRDGASVGVVAASGPWPRAGALARDREDKDTDGSWAKEKEEDAGAWTKRSVNSARENGYPSSSRIKDAQLDRARSSSFADMLRGAQPPPGGEDAPSASPLVKSKSAKTPKTTSVELLTPAWGSGKPGGAPSFATVLLGGSSATVSSDKSAPPPAISFVDSKAGVPAVSPATTVSSSPVAASEAGAWGGDTVPTPATPSASKPAPPKPMAWTTGNTTSVLLFGSAGKPGTRSKGPTADESQKEQTTFVANGESEDEGKDSARLSTKASASGKETEGRESVTPNGRRSPTSCCSEDSRLASEAEGGGGMGDVVVEVLAKVDDVIVKRAHSRANKAESYARAIAEREGRAHALATAHQRQDGLLHDSWEDKPSSTQPVVTILAAETTTSSAQGALESVGGVEPAPGTADGSRSDEISEAVPAEGGIVPTDSGEGVALAGDVSTVGSTVTDDDGDNAGDANPLAGVIDDPFAIAVPAFVAAPLSVVDEPTPAAILEPSAAEQSCSVPSAPDRAAEREGSGRLGGMESAFVSRNGAGQEEQRRRGALQADNGGGGRVWTERGSDRASWSRGNTPPNVSRNSGRRGSATDTVGGRTWSRSGHAMGGGGGNMAGVPSNDFRGGRPRVQRAASLMTPPHQQQQPQGLEAENWRGTIPIPRAPVVLRSSMSTPISAEVGVGIDAGDASARGYTGQSDAVAPSPRVAPSPTGHRPRSSSAGGSSARRKGMNAGGGMAGVHYPHFQQMDSWNGNEWTHAGGGEGGGGGGTRRGVRSGGGGGGWQGRDGDVGRPHYPYRDDNLYRSSPMEARAHSSGGGGGASSRHSRQDHVAPRRRGHLDALPRAFSAHDQQQAQQQIPLQQQQQQPPQMPLQQQQQPQMPQVPPARFRSRSGGTNDLSISDRRAERMEYEYNLMVSCLDRNVDGFMQKLRRAMCPRRRAWSQVIARVRELVAGIWKEAKVEMYGSCYTGLELPSSDVDVVVCGINGFSYTYGGSRAGYNGMQTVANLQKLANVLQEQNWVRGMKVIETAVVPVIKILADPSMDGANGQSLFEEEGGRDCWQGSGSGMDYIPLDISFESPQHGGLASSKWVRNCIQGGKYGFALPAVMVLKEVLCQRGLNQPWSGGLSSYSLINMMITVLQRAEVERARARRIVARSHAAAQAAAHIVRQGGLPPPQGMPTLSPQVSVGPQPQTMPPLSPQVSGGPLPSVFAPLPHQAPVSGLATAHVPLVSVSAANFDNVSQDARVDATDGALLQKHQSQPAGENGGGGAGTAPCNTGFGRPQSQACAAASGESSSLNPMVSGDGSGGRSSARPLSTSAEVGDEAMQQTYFAAGDATADHPQPASLVKRTSYWVETDPSRGVGVGVGSLPANGEPGVQPATTDGFVGASMTGVSGNTTLPNGMSPGVHAGRVGRAGAALPEEATQASATQAMSVTGAPPTMYPAQAGQASMQQAPMPPVQGAMLPTGPPVTLTVAASPVTQHSIGINADLFHMKHMEIALSQEEVDRADLSGMTPGEVLVRFLEFFGRQFDPSRLGISVGRGALGNPFPLSPGVDPRTGMAVMDAHMVIEDPLDRDQNVARSCFGFPNVQWLFGQCLSLLQDRGAEMAEYDCNADLLKMLVYF